MKTQTEKIILYSNHCPKCKILKERLDLNGIDYEENNDINVLENRDIMTVPILEVEGTIMNFAEAISWINTRDVN